MLKARGMSFADVDFAERCLVRIGYYRLSAYWYPFRDFCALDSEDDRQVRCDSFVAGTTFQHALDFYLHDKEIRLMISDALERIEIGMRATLVEVLGSIDAHAHRNSKSYNATLTKADQGTDLTRLDEFLKGLDDAFQGSKEEFAKHFLRTYSGDPPIWIGAGAWDWGNLAYMFRYLTHTNMDKICEKIDPALNRKTLISWMANLNEVRNACAHHSRLWNKVLTNRPAFQPQGQLDCFDHMRDAQKRIKDHHSTRLYGALMAIIYLMKRLHPKTEWHIRFAKLVKDSNLPKAIAEQAAGFPATWQGAQIWK